jgi:hypothetical protein
MKRTLLGVCLGTVIVATAAWTWSRTAEHSPDMAEGLYVKCTRADCGHCYVIPWSESRSYPRGPNNEGFHCPKCRKFAGRIAAQCDQCGEWMVAGEAAARSGGCPHCEGKVKQ